MQYAMFLVLTKIRGLSAEQLAETLYAYLTKEVGETFDSNDDLLVHQQNRNQLHKFLARITDYAEVAAGGVSNYAELTNAKKVKYEVEHIWADHPERHADEFGHESDFARHRNRIGGLLLLPKSFNASYNDDTYEDKLEHYFSPEHSRREPLFEGV